MAKRKHRDGPGPLSIFPITSCSAELASNHPTYTIIGERERANLVVQPARFFHLFIYIYIYMDDAVAHTVMFYVSSNFT